jgi:hypothetical protein
MARSLWVDHVEGLAFDGEITVVTLLVDGETVVLRGKRSTALVGLERCQQDYRACEEADRLAKVLLLDTIRRKPDHD